MVAFASAQSTLPREARLLNRGVFINPALHYVVSGAMTDADIDFTLEMTGEALEEALA